MKSFALSSKHDNLPLEVCIIAPKGTPKGIVQFSHGMAEHKERYFDFMNFLAQNGYLCVIHDHRGHGASVKNRQDLGYFYTENAGVIADDLFQLTQLIKAQYPGLPLMLFSHSMGTLVARNYLKQHDNAIEKLVLCGPPTQNALTPIGIGLAKLLIRLQGPTRRSWLIQQLTFGSYNRGHRIKNSWICSAPDTVSRYNEDPLCSYQFTNNGFLNLFGLMKGAYDKRGWAVKNPSLPILILAGQDDPVIQNERKLNHLAAFLRERGYQRVTYRLYEGLRHELLNETGREKIYQTLLTFFDGSSR